MEFNEDELSAEELAEIEAEQKESAARLELGQRCDLDCAPHAESLMTGSTFMVQNENEKVCVDRDSLPRGAVVKQQFFEGRERLSFTFSVTKINIAVEKLSVQTEGGMTLVTASTEELGPPKSKVTWEFLSSMAVLVAQYALPLNRFAALASSPVKVFKASEIARHFQYVASRFVAIYLQLAKDLANSPVLLGDDTSSRVVEVTKGLKESALSSDTVLPWADYATEEKAAIKIKEMAAKHKDPGIATKLAATLGFEFDRRDGTGTKIGFDTSVLSGRSEACLIAKKWSAASELGKAARYIIKNYEKLTYYLQDYRLAFSNNFSARMLRLERLIENNALFRQNLGGRFSLDVMRTVLQTAIAAKVDLQLYLMWVMSMPPEVVDAAQADFTPLAFARLKSQHIAP